MGVPLQMPPTQWSLSVLASPSSQTVPSGRLVPSHFPVAALQAVAGQATEVGVPLQTPAWQRSFVVQALLSLQEVPSGALG